jgi:hypothetical protein
MGWTTFWENAKQGKLGDAFSGAMVPEEDIERGRAADQALLALNEQNRARGIITEEQFADSQARLQKWSTDELLTNDKYSPWGGFKEGLNDGAKNIKGAIGGGINFGFSMIPWQLWALGAVALAVYFWPMLRPVVAGRLKRLA